jgi:hypothetical protein
MPSSEIVGLDLATASLQNVFDFIVFRLVQQGHRSGAMTEQTLSDGGPRFSCMYRAADGGRCAAGQVIPDAEYKPVLEGSAVSALLGRSDNLMLSEERQAELLVPSLAQWATTHAPDGLTLLTGLQHAHDLYDTPPAEADAITDTAWLAHFREYARNVARKLDLDDSIVRYREAVLT